MATQTAGQDARAVRQRGTVDAARTPRGVRAAIVAFIAALLAGAVYLIVVRGDALLLDLSKLGAALCF